MVLPELEIYLFDDRSRPIGSSVIQSGAAKIETSIDASRAVRAIVGPRGMHSFAVLANTALPSTSASTADLKTIEMEPGWWNTFLHGQVLRYHGCVDRIFGEGRYPICDGTVEVFEIDPFQWIQTRSDLEIARVRDTILNATQPWRFDRTTTNVPFGSGTNGNRNGNPFWNTTGYSNATGNGSFQGSWNAPSNPTPTVVWTAARFQGETLRNWFWNHRQELLPYFGSCLPEGWFHADKLGEAKVQADGTFHGYVGWWVAGSERPDLYFRVRQTVQGNDTTVYAPSIGTSTWWNYGGQEIVLPVFHPNSACREPGSEAVGNQVFWRGIGTDTFCTAEGDAGLIPDGQFAGRYRTADRRHAAYGGTLHFTLDLDPAGLAQAGVAFYRMSWCRGRNHDAGARWTPITTPIHRHYRVTGQTENGVQPAYSAVSLVPGPSGCPDALASEQGIFKIPDPNLEYVLLTPEDRAYGIWDTTMLFSGAAMPEEIWGIHTVRLELFDAYGKDVTAEVPIFNYFGSFASRTNGRIRQCTPFMYVHVDNRPATAEIDPGYGSGNGTNGNGVQITTPGTTPGVGIRAWHPAGFVGDWRFTITRGRNQETIYQCGGEGCAGNESNWMRFPNGNGNAPTTAEMFAGIPETDDPCYARSCNFGFQLEAFSLIRDGYGYLESYCDVATTNVAMVEPRMSMPFPQNTP
ncbi:MAG TPA: hypothetical protein VGC54_03935 [Planctomycetota bacterium]